MIRVLFLRSEDLIPGALESGNIGQILTVSMAMRIYAIKDGYI